MALSSEYNPPNTATGLSEDEVKRRFASFLREFYRERYEPMPNSVQTSMDNVGEGGIVADGMMQFRKNDGSPFVCTYEATSRDKAEEVKFALNLVYFLWDCAAFAMVCTAIAYFFAYQTNRVWLISLRGAGNLGFLIGTWMIAFFSWYFTMHKWKKYRYIYAIQQFKQYAADEQWIALADDVFPSPTDPYLLELRNQCVFSGFGLALVSVDTAPRVLAAPSRLRIYGEGRQMLHWVTRAQWYQSVSGGFGGVSFSMPNAWTVVWNKLTRSLRYYLWDPVKKQLIAALAKPFGGDISVYSRFMTGRYMQKMFFAISLFTCIFLANKVLSYRAEDTVDVEELRNWRAGRNPEDQPGELPPESEPIPYDGKAPGVPKQYPVAEDKAQTVDLTASDDDASTIDLSGGETAKETKKTAAIKAKPKDQPPKPKPKPQEPDGCSLLKGRAGWIVQENAFSTRESAIEHVKLLRANKITCNWTSQACLTPGRTGYIVWLGDIQTIYTTAQSQQATLTKALQKAKLPKAKLLLRKI
jgi:cell division septation protein DedD